MIMLLLAQASPPPLDVTFGPAFPADRLACVATVGENAPFAMMVRVKKSGRKNIAELRSDRPDLFPTGKYEISDASIMRQADGKPVDYRVSMSGSQSAGRYTLGMIVKNNVPESGWLRFLPAGQPFRSDLIQSLGTIDCSANAAQGNTP